MRLLSINVRNYRIHEDLTVELDPARTVISGPNESGKSTLAEAAHRALFLKAKISGEAQKNMVSKLKTGHPEVEVRFEAAGDTYRIAKRFSGSTGTATLARDGGGIWKQEEAESKLSELLGVEDLGGGRGAAKRSAKQWAHLWVRQGESGNDPSPHADNQRDSLISRLSEDGNAAVMESELDSQVASRFASARDELFTKNNQPKAHSELDRANASLAEAETKLESARQIARQLQQAVHEFNTADSAIRDKGAELRSLSASQIDAEKKLEQVKQLRHREELETRDLRQAIDASETLAGHDREITDLSEKILQLARALEPGEAETEQLESAVQNRKESLQKAVETGRELDRELKSARLKLQLADAIKERFERESQHSRLARVTEEVSALQESVQALDTELAKLPAISATSLSLLNELATSYSEARIALEAMASGVTVKISEAPVTVGDEVLEAGDNRIIARDTEVSIGNTTRLLITPGGGTRLADTRRQVEESQRYLEEALNNLGIESLDTATRIRERRMDLESQRKTRHAELKAKDASTIGEQLAAAAQALEAASANANRRRKAVGISDPDPADSHEAATELAATARSAVEKLESQESEIRTRIDRAERAFSEAENRLQSHRQSIELSRAEHKCLQIKLATLEESHGNGEKRKEKLLALTQTRREAEAKLKETRKDLETLQPKSLETDLLRFARAIQQTREAVSNAEQQRAVALSALTRDGNTDPAEALALAEAEVESTRGRQVNVKRKAEAVRLLAELFAEEQRALAHQFTQPLAGKITGYLQQIFGPEARAEITLADGKFKDPLLARGAGAYDFEKLSAGTREQVAAAFRLAMAEVLAEDHGGCLPILFDDAFTQSDPDRVQNLQRMLDLAARRGLQVILLTCHPANYTGLGAKTVTLA